MHKSVNKVIPLVRPFNSPEIERSVLEVLRSGRIASGPVVEDFERKMASYLGVKHVVAANTGTAALHLAFLACGIGSGAEVVTTPFSFFASTSVILQTGAKPIFADINPSTYNISPANVKKSITERTRAIEPVHLYGQPCEMDELLETASEHDLYVIEDAAQAIGAEYKGRKAGSLGDVGCFSTYVSKNLHTGEGGFLATDNEEIAEKARVLGSHGQIGKYNHVMLGFNYRMNEIEAAIGREQIPLLDGFNETRRKNASLLRDELKGVQGIVTPTEIPDVKHVYHQFTVRVTKPGGRETRDSIVAALRGEGIEADVHYPTIIPLQPVSRGKVAYAEGQCSEAELAAQTVISLPISPVVSSADLEREARTLSRAVMLT
jgi:dTDP-4-amino-4,6-dideoxygalactose transaminase